MHDKVKRTRRSCSVGVMVPRGTRGDGNPPTAAKTASAKPHLRAQALRFSENAAAEAARRGVCRTHADVAPACRKCAHPATSLQQGGDRVVARGARCPGTVLQGRTTPAQERTGGLRSILFCELLVGRNTARTSVTNTACESGAV